MTITILGNGSGGPFHGRHYTAQLVQRGREVFLIDCGEGAQMQVFRFRAKIDRCAQIFISHLHGDHVFGLMGLLTNWCLKKRNEPLQLFSPPGLQELVETTIRICGVKMTYPLSFITVDAARFEKVFENQTLEVWSIPLNHRTPTAGWLFREKPKPLNIRPDAIQTYGLAGRYALIRAIKAGADLPLPDGRVVPNQDLTLPPTTPVSYAFCSDTAPSAAVAAAVAGVDLLYHEATFRDEHLEEARLSYHSTARQAAEIAQAAGVGRLLLGHFSGRYDDLSGHLSEAMDVFPATDLATEGSRWTAGR